MFDILHVESFLTRQSQDPARCANDDVRTIHFDDLLIFLDWHATEEYSNLHTVHVLAEALVFFADLKRQLPRVAEHNTLYLVI